MEGLELTEQGAEEFDQILAQTQGIGGLLMAMAMATKFKPVPRMPPRISTRIPKLPKPPKVPTFVKPTRLPKVPKLPRTKLPKPPTVPKVLDATKVAKLPG